MRPMVFHVRSFVLENGHIRIKRREIVFLRRRKLTAVLKSARKSSSENEVKRICVNFFFSWVIVNERVKRRKGNIFSQLLPITQSSKQNFTSVLR